MPPLAQRNLFHDKVRLAVTLTGIVFAVVLIVVELGLFVGFTVTTSNLIDNSGADLWVTSKHVPYVEQGVPFSERKVYQVRAVPGVAKAEKLITRWVEWKRPDGRQESVQVVGLNVDENLGRPWNLVQGRVEDLKRPDAIIMDEIYRQKLGVDHAEQLFEINGKRARVVGFTQGIRAFTTSPYVFTTFKRAQEYANVPDDQTTYILVKLAPGANPEQVRHDILDRVKDVDVVTNREFSRMTQFYWMFTTGAGVAVLLAALLGLGRRLRRSCADHLRDDHGSLARIRHAESDGRAQQLRLQGHHQAGGDQRRHRLFPRHDRQRVRGARQPKGRRGHPDAHADGDWHVFSDAVHVCWSSAGFHQQGHAARSRNGVQRLKWRTNATSHCSSPGNEELH